MGDFFKEALDLPETLRFQLAMLLLHSLQPQWVEEETLSEDQLKALYEAKAEVQSGKAKLLSREELKVSIQALRDEHKRAS